MMTGSEDKSQMNTAKNVAIVLAAGQGRRMHSDVPKQFLDLCGRPVAAWSLQAFQDFPGVDAVILVTSEEDIEYCQSELIDKYRFDKVKRIVSGGAERYLSVWKGLQAAKEYLQEMNSVESIVFIHDGARPVIDAALLDRALACAKENKACVAGMPVKDTIKIADEDGFAQQTPDRRLVWQVQTPQVFSFSLVYGAYQRLIADGITNVTDDAMVVELESSTRVKLVEGSYRNLKITTPEDLLTAEQFLQK